ncbi:hypothetical protein FQR65_LT09426 [Abscondita terminalis]|nr:hypothetical protein FQR65_LT09426 [Abscondita terminalis]
MLLSLSFDGCLSTELQICIAMKELNYRKNVTEHESDKQQILMIDSLLCCSILDVFTNCGDDAVRSPLSQPYSGPHEVIDRQKEKMMQIKVNNKTINVSIDRVKPAFLTFDSNTNSNNGNSNNHPNNTLTNSPVNKATKSHPLVVRVTKYGRTIKLSSVYKMKSYNVSTPIRTKSSLQVALPQITAVMVKNLLLVSFGMTLGFPTILIPGLSENNKNEDFRLNEQQISWIGSINLMCVPVGCLLSGFLTQPVGRKRSMQIITLPLAASWLIFRFSNKVWHIYLALSVTGLCGGLVEAPVLSYVAEITRPTIRGMLSATSTLSVTLGVLLQFLVGTVLPWRTVTLVCLGPPILSFCLLSLLPESPHWLIMHNKLKQAQKSLAWFRGWAHVDEIKEEFEAMFQSHKQNSHRVQIKDGIVNLSFEDSISNLNNQEPISNEKKSLANTKIEHIKLFTRKNFLWPFGMVTFIYFLSNFTGAWTLQTYAVNIFSTLKAPMNKYYATILLGVAEFVASFICIFAVRYFGKRFIGFMSICAVGLCDVVIGVYAHVNGIQYVLFKQDDLLLAPTIDEHNWVPLVFLLLIAFAGHCGLRSLPWMLIGEIFSHETRATGCGLASAVSYVCGFLANKIFLNMINSLTIAGTYWFYGGLSFFGCLIMYYILPETEGKSLQEISDHFSEILKMDNKVKRRTNKTVSVIM